jgi:hypothetical protein
MSPKRCDTSKDYRYGNRPYDNTGNAIVMLQTIIGMVIGKNYHTGNAIVTLCIITGMVISQVTVPVMLS